MLQIYEFIVDQTAKGRSFLLFFCLLMMQTPSFAQNSAKITIQKKNISVIEALKEIEKQSDYSVGYNDSQLKNKPVLNLDLKAATLEYALSQILRGSGFTYQFKDKYIMIIPDKKLKETPTKKVSGIVIDENNEPLIGVNIKVEGSSEGAITDIDGNFNIMAPQGSTLSFTYVGYTPQTVKITDKNIYEIRLASDTKQLNEVVVTALGIKREQKALSYNVQQVKSDQLTTIKDANFVNSLSGKVAGVIINSSSSGVGGASKVVMRGTKSIEKSNNALYVIDGIPSEVVAAQNLVQKERRKVLPTSIRMTSKVCPFLREQPQPPFMVAMLQMELLLSLQKRENREITGQCFYRHRLVETIRNA